MHNIIDQSFEGERQLFALKDTILKNVKFNQGESPVKQAGNIKVSNCTFDGKYPFWHNCNIEINHSYFKSGGRAAIWYSEQVRMHNCNVEAPKMFRVVNNLYIENSVFPHAHEYLWNCEHVSLLNVEFSEADYILMNGRNIFIKNMELNGNYSFQDARNVIVMNSNINSKDAFWNTENVTVFNSTIKGEYLGWHSKNLKLINCKISGEQPLCYASNLVMQGCVMEETDLCFEYSTLNVDIDSNIESIKNPAEGRITAKSIGEIILDEHCINPGACLITIGGKVYEQSI